MKRVVILLMVLAFGQSFAWGQKKVVQQNTDVVAIGVEGGFNLSQMLYTDAHLNRLSKEAVFLPVGGLFVDIPVGDFVTLSPTAMFAQRGGAFSYTHRSGAQVRYALSVRYADLRLPIEVRLNLAQFFKPYLSLGMEGGYRLGGQIDFSRTEPIAFDTLIDVGNANVATMHVGVFYGFGIRSDLNMGCFDLHLKLNATYHLGFVDSYSPMEHAEQSQPVNINAYNITGKRYLTGLEVTFGIALPLQFRSNDDPCSTFSKGKYNRRKHSKDILFGF